MGSIHRQVAWKRLAQVWQASYGSWPLLVASTDTQIRHSSKPAQVQDRDEKWECISALAYAALYLMMRLQAGGMEAQVWQASRGSRPLLGASTDTQIRHSSKPAHHKILVYMLWVV